MSASRSSGDVGDMSALDTSIGGNAIEDSLHANAASNDAPILQSRNTERSAVVIALFGATVGPCVGDFSTTYNRVNGRLYAATRAVLFYSNLFGFERRLCLQFSDIESIEAYRSTSIRICMVDCEDHVFRKFLNRDEVLAVLKELYDKQVDTMPDVSSSPSFPLSQPLHGGIGSEDGPSNSSISLRATTTPRRHVSKREARQQQDGEEEWDQKALRQRLSSEASPAPPSGRQMGSSAAARPRSHSVPSLGPNRGHSHNAQSPRVRRFRRVQSTLSTKGNAAPSLSNSISLSSRSAMSENSPEASCLSLHSTLDSSSPPAPPGFDVEMAWSKKKKPYNEIALKKFTLSCNLDGFMDTFFSDEAAFPISRYQQEHIKDKEISYSNWKQRRTQCYPPIFDREIRFIHPLNNTVGPSQAMTNRQQSFQRYGNSGICIQNTTMIQGVPGADCFRMEDRWIVEYLSNSSVTITVSFQLIFSKRTMFKPIIQKNSKAETKKWFSGYAKFLVRALRDDEQKEGVTVATPPLELTDSDMEPSTGEGDTFQRRDTALLSLGAIGIAIVCMIFLVYQLFYLQQLLLGLQRELILIQHQNDELASAIQAMMESSRACPSPTSTQYMSDENNEILA